MYYQIKFYPGITNAGLVEIFAAIPEGITSIDMSQNSFNNITGAALAQGFAHFPPSVTSLDLSLNDLGLGIINN
jgi:hypothetical protein